MLKEREQLALALLDPLLVPVHDLGWVETGCHGLHELACLSDMLGQMPLR